MQPRHTLVTRSNKESFWFVSNFSGKQETIEPVRRGRGRSSHKVEVNGGVTVLADTHSHRDRRTSRRWADYRRCSLPDLSSPDRSLLSADWRLLYDSSPGKSADIQSYLGGGFERQRQQQRPRLRREILRTCSLPAAATGHYWRRVAGYGWRPHWETEPGLAGLWARLRAPVAPSLARFPAIAACNARLSGASDWLRHGECARCWRPLANVIKLRRKCASSKYTVQYRPFN